MKKILFAGEGGQGVQSIAEILAKAAFIEGLNVTYIPNFGVEQRGGVSIAFVIIDKKPIAYPKFREADFLVVLSDRSFDRIKIYQGKQTKLILGSAFSKGPKTGPQEKSWNIFVLGKVNHLGRLVSRANLIKAMDERFSRQYANDSSLKYINEQALDEAEK